MAEGLKETFYLLTQRSAHEAFFAESAEPDVVVCDADSGTVYEGYALARNTDDPALKGRPSDTIVAFESAALVYFRKPGGAPDIEAQFADLGLGEAQRQRVRAVRDFLPGTEPGLFARIRQGGLRRVVS